MTRLTFSQVWAAGVISAAGELVLQTTREDTLYLYYYLRSEDKAMLMRLARAVGVSTRRVHEMKKKPGVYIFSLSGNDQVTKVIKLLWPALSEGRKRTYNNGLMAIAENEGLS